MRWTLPAAKEEGGGRRPNWSTAETVAEELKETSKTKGGWWSKDVTARIYLWLLRGATQGAKEVLCAWGDF